MNALSRIRNLFRFPRQVRAWELGAFCPPGNDDGWQRDLRLNEMDANSMAYACVMMYARTIMQCAPKHLVKDPETEAFKRSTSSPAARVFRRPNEYETWAQLIMNTVCDIGFHGQCGWVVSRDDRNAIIAVHRVPYDGWSPAIDPETKAVFYPIGDLADGLIPENLMYAVPARDFAHFRMYTPRHPLLGESPIAAAAIAVGISAALSRSQLAFFSQMRRPSGILTTESVLTPIQMKQLRAAFDEQSKGMNQGQVPILGGSLRFSPMSISSVDSQLIETQKMTSLDVARVFGIPMVLLSENSGPQGGTEAVINHWLSTSLGAFIESIERTLDRLFDFGPNDHVELDTRPLMRADFSARVDSLTKAIAGGLLSPNEARAREGWAPVAFGDEPRLQAQVVPLSQVNAMASAPSAPSAPSSTPAEAIEGADEKPTGKIEGEDEKGQFTIDPATAEDIARATIAKAMSA